MDGDERKAASHSPADAQARAVGSATDRVVLTRELISTARLADGLRRIAAGAVVTFEGTVRAEREPRSGSELIALEYTAYEEMAREQMAALRDKALRDFEILDAALAHRLGRLGLGEVSVAVAVAAAHRAAAFEACRWLIDTLKCDVPVWKKEVLADGQSQWTGPDEHRVRP